MTCWLGVTAAVLLSSLLLATQGAAADLLLQPIQTLTGGQEIENGRFGESVTLSSDGSTALVGGPRDNERAGAAWVFARAGTTWSQQAKLTGSGESREGFFGRSVALSADGSTALIGGPLNHGEAGAVWVFTRSAQTWTQQARLIGEGLIDEGHFGGSIALSADGNTALIGSPGAHTLAGRAWVFTRSGRKWSQQGPKLIGGGEVGEGNFGRSVSLSSDGNTALIGGGADNVETGAAWIFTRSGQTWTQQGPKLTGGGEVGAGEFGSSAALSAAGDKALVGGFLDNGKIGAAWVFARSGQTWTQQGPKLTGEEESGEGHFGDSVALSADGNSALIGGESDHTKAGAAWIFASAGSTWTQQGSKLAGVKASGEQLGNSVALSADGKAALLGSPGSNANVGAAGVFAIVAPPPPPTALSSPPAAFGTLAFKTSRSSAKARLRRPVLSHVAESNRVWRESNVLATFARRRRPPHGTTFSFALDESANVHLAFGQRVVGRRVGGRCVALSKRNAARSRCVRTVNRGSLSFVAHAGTNKVFFAGRIARSQRLGRGGYTLTITASNPAGAAASIGELSFTIVK